MMDDEAQTNDELSAMYQEVILQASRNAHGKTHFAQSQDLTQSEASSSPSSSSSSSPSSSPFVTGEDSFAHVSRAHESCLIGHSHQFNPTCGDEVTMRVELAEMPESSSTDSPIIQRIQWDGHGCSISQASLSIMVDLVEGKSVQEALEITRIFHALMRSRGEGLRDEAQEELLGDAIALQGTSRYPMRIKCALLAYEALKDAIAKALAS